MVTTPITTIQPRQSLILNLMNFRREWEVTAEGESLLDVNGSVGLIFAELLVIFDLTDEEQRLAMGPDLYDEVAWLFE